MNECALRIDQGIKALKNNDNYWQAFVLANRAMLYQMMQNQLQVKIFLLIQEQFKGALLNSYFYLLSNHYFQD